LIGCDVPGSEAKELVWKIVENKIPSYEWAFFPYPLDKDEFFKATQHMDKGRSLGLDGLPCEFYLTLCQVVGDDFLNMCQEALDMGDMGEQINVGPINLIPKGSKDFVGQ
jgi:hypothetical protein